MRAVPSFLVLLLVAGPALGHGATTQQVKPLGPYQATFFAYDYVTEGEDVQASWEVLDNATGTPVDAGSAVVVVTEVGADGTERNRTERHPGQLQPGYVVMDVRAPRQGVLRYELRLDGHAARFEQQVCAVDAEGQLRCGADASGRGSPAPAVAAVLALAAGAALRLRRR